MTTNHLEGPVALLPLRRGVILPGRTTSIPVGRERSITLARELEPGEHVLLGVQRDPKVDDPALADLQPIAVLAKVRDRSDRGRRGVFLLVEALERVELRSLTQTSPFWMAQADSVDEVRGATEEAEALADSLKSHVLELTSNDTSVTGLLETADSPSALADHVSGWLDTPAESKVPLLLELDVVSRLEKAADLLKEAQARAELKEKVDSRVRGELNKHQRDVLLREQLKAIRRELGDGADGEDELDLLRSKLDDKDLPEEVQKAVDRELRRLESLNGQGAEANVIRTYLETLAELPWSERADTHQDIHAISETLDADHYGLDEVKRRVLEHMAVLKLSTKARATILCLVGPPGVGKTSLAQSVASATGRPLARVSLGGVRDEAEIRGHRRTYVGALPGRIISALRKVQVRNPVVVLDEVDKLGRGWAGDPEAALLELLDPEQNDKFTDHYLELPFDLSEVLFIATANDITALSAPLRDRLEIIEVSGYTLEEKVRIARGHLLPEALDDHGLPKGTVEISDAILEQVAKEYTREAGVRQMKRQIAKLCRWIALEFAKSEEPGTFTVAERDLRTILGRPRFIEERSERFATPGVASGLAWTPVGGDILFIETTKMKGKGRLEITGQLGEVMTESARAALAYLRSRSDEYGIEADVLDTQDLHIHVPAGAVPKDGPSAGVTIFTALGSLLTGRRVRSDTAMTGEATLRGRVLPVGGIKSKVLAAHRAGFSRVLLPKRNEADLDDVPETVREALEIVLVSDMREVFDLALEPDARTPANTNEGPRTDTTDSSAAA